MEYIVASSTEGAGMSVVIEGAVVNRCEIAADGSSVRLGFRDREGRPVALILPPDCVSALIMTLPGIMQQLVRLKHRDPSLRVVYPLGGWTVEQASDGESLILSLRTGDGFSVAFSLKPPELAQIADASDAPLRETRLN
jgi:hypothetical protein